MRAIHLYNNFSREKEQLVPYNEGFIGMYVCGPTVYNDVHLGNCRTFVSFDIIYRYLLNVGYKVRYVRNITDVGHLLDDGEDRILKGARLEKKEPMEIVQQYTNGFHAMMRIFNTLSPSIEPRATGHIIEQIEMIEQILKNGFGYIENGSVYFDTLKFAKETGEYGKLSGRVIEDLLSESRDNLKNQDEKRHPSDFALWIKAASEHIMKWNSPWSVGFPGWHLECSAMSTKYLGEKFDIHGGGNDLKFPHHENEIAQNVGACGCQPAKYWLHTNMLLMNGKKMSKSDGNTISPEELFSGESDHVSQGYGPMTVKFFMLQSHYRSTLDITDEALKAAEKGYKRLMESHKTLRTLESPTLENGSLDVEINQLMKEAYEEMDDDFSTPRALAKIFEIVPKINSLKEGHIDIAAISKPCLDALKSFYKNFLTDIFGLLDELESGSGNGPLNGLMELILDLRHDARDKKDWATSDKIRDGLESLKIKVKDNKEGSTWSVE